MYIYKANKELEQYILTSVKEHLEYDESFIEQNASDIHTELFCYDATYDPYVTYHGAAKAKLKDWDIDVLEAIEFIQECEEDHFGECHFKDFTSYEAVCNGVAYWLSFELIQDMDLGDIAELEEAA